MNFMLFSHGSLIPRPETVFFGYQSLMLLAQPQFPTESDDSTFQSYLSSMICLNLHEFASDERP